MLRSKRAGANALAFAVAAWCSAESAQATQYNTVALSGSTGTTLGLGPNIGAGVDFSSFSKPRLNASGQVAFLGTVAGTGIVAGSNSSGIFTNTAGSVGAVVREGAGGPGPNLSAGVDFNSFNDPVFNAAGKIAFAASLEGAGVTGANSGGIFTNAGGAIGAVARTDTPSLGPNIGAGVNFNGVINPVMNDAGTVAFTATLAGSGVVTGPGGNSWGVFTSAAGGPSALAARGGATTNNSDTFTSPVINASGSLAFRGTSSDTAGHMFTHTAGVTTRLATSFVSNSLGPNVPIDGTFDMIGFPLFNDAGQVAFTGRADFNTGSGTATTQGAWIHSAGVNNAAVRNTFPATVVGAGVFFANTSNHTLNGAGSLAFTGAVFGTGITTANDQGIFTRSAGGTFGVVARENTAGAAGPNLGGNLVFGSFPNSPVLNGAGDVAFVAVLAGTGITTANDTGLFVSVDGTTTPIAREGDLFDVDPGAGIDLRTISAISFENTATASGGQDGRATAFNDAGVLAFGLSFTDGSSGVFTALVPEPASLGLLALAGLSLVRRRR